MIFTGRVAQIKPLFAPLQVAHEASLLESPGRVNASDCYAMLLKEFESSDTKSEPIFQTGF